MSSVGLIMVGWLLGHRMRETNATCAHLDDYARQDATEQAVGRFAGAMGF